MRIVLDTNVYISSLMFQGKARKVYDHCVMHEEVFISGFIVNEVSRILLEKFNVPKPDVNKIVAEINSVCTLVNPIGTIPDLCRDKDDNNILHLAKDVKADYIVSGDKDLLSIVVFKKTKIVSPADFVSSIIDYQ